MDLDQWVAMPTTRVPVIQKAIALAVWFTPRQGTPARASCSLMIGEG